MIYKKNIVKMMTIEELLNPSLNDQEDIDNIYNDNFIFSFPIPPSKPGSLYVGGRGSGKSQALKTYMLMLNKMSFKETKAKYWMDISVWMEQEALKFYKEAKNEYFKGHISDEGILLLLDNNPCLLKHMKEAKPKHQVYAVKRDARAILGTKHVCDEAQKIAILSESFSLNTNTFLKRFLSDKKIKAKTLTLLLTRCSSYYHDIIKSHKNYVHNANMAEALLENLQENY